MPDNEIKPRIHRRDGRPAVLTTDIALAFGRRHNDLVIAIRKLLAIGEAGGFHATTYLDSQDREQPAFLVNVEGFDLLTRGWCRAGDTERREQWLSPFRALDMTEVSQNIPETPSSLTDDLRTPVATGPESRSLESVEFHGQTLYLVEHCGEPYVPMKPVVEGMGLAWGAQFLKISQRFGSTISEIEMVAQDGKTRLMVCLPLRKLPGWLYTIYPNKVRPDLADRIIRYQEECDEVLWNYWTHGRADNPRVTDLVITSDQARYLYFLKATHGFAGHSSRQPRRNQVSPNAAGVLWFFDRRAPDTPDGWHACTLRSVADALNLNPGNVSTLIGVLNRWGFLESRRYGPGNPSVHRLDLPAIDAAAARSDLDGALGDILANLPVVASRCLH